MAFSSHQSFQHAQMDSNQQYTPSLTGSDLLDDDLEIDISTSELKKRLSNQLLKNACFIDPQNHPVTGNTPKTVPVLTIFTSDLNNEQKLDLTAFLVEKDEHTRDSGYLSSKEPLKRCDTADSISRDSLKSDDLDELDNISDLEDNPIDACQSMIPDGLQVTLENSDETFSFAPSAESIAHAVPFRKQTEPHDQSSFLKTDSPGPLKESQEDDFDDFGSEFNSDCLNVSTIIPQNSKSIRKPYQTITQDAFLQSKSSCSSFENRTTGQAVIEQLDAKASKFVEDDEDDFESAFSTMEPLNTINPNADINPKLKLFKTFTEDDLLQLRSTGSSSSEKNQIKGILKPLDVKAMQYVEDDDDFESSFRVDPNDSEKITPNRNSKSNNQAYKTITKEAFMKVSSKSPVSLNTKTKAVVKPLDQKAMKFVEDEEDDFGSSFTTDAFESANIITKPKAKTPFRTITNDDFHKLKRNSSLEFNPFARTRNVIKPFQSKPPTIPVRNVPSRLSTTSSTMPKRPSVSISNQATKPPTVPRTEKKPSYKVAFGRTITEPKKTKQKPVLIRNLNTKDQAKTIGDMTFDPVLQKWTGNENILKVFDRKTVRPSLITPDNLPVQVGEMTFDPVKLCWTGNESNQDEAHIFDDIESFDITTGNNQLTRPPCFVYV